MCKRCDKSKAGLCTPCYKKREAARNVEACATVNGGACPCCAQPLRRNLALTGWWQCSGYGAEGFRANGSTPCSYQVFAYFDRLAPVSHQS